jgi:hypothetical protein
MPSAPSSGIPANLEALFSGAEKSGLFGGHVGATDSDDSGDSDDSDNTVTGTSYLNPGGGSQKSKSEKKKKDKKKSQRDGPREEPLAKTIQGLVSSGVNIDGNMMIGLALLQQAQAAKGDGGDKKKKKKKKQKKKRRSSSSSSSSEDTDNEQKGCKEVSAYHKLVRDMKKHPKKVWKRFEAEAVHELGIVPGQSWTLRDWVKALNWRGGAHQKRAAYLIVLIYESIRRGEEDLSLAQCVQAIKALRQSSIANGSWDAAWRFTGQEDPWKEKRFAGTEEELAVIGGYQRALAEIEKKMDGGGGKGGGRGEEDGKDGKKGKNDG